METQAKQKRRPSWVWTFLPYNAGTNGFSTLLPLFVRQLGGTVVDFGVMSTVYNLAVTLTQVLWGAATDRLARRRLFFVIAFVGSGLIYVSMYLFPTLEWLTIGYGILGIVIFANGAAAYLLVYESSEKRHWVSSFSMLSLVTNLGAVAGLVAGIFWSTFLPLNGFILFCAACEGVALILTYRLLSEPQMLLESAQLELNPTSIFSRVYRGATGTVALEAPKRLLKLLRSQGDQERKLMYSSSFVFAIANSLQGTPWTPFLLAYRVGDNEAFAVTLVSAATQIFAFKWMSTITKKRGVANALLTSILARSALFILSALMAIFASGTGLFVAALIWNIVSGFSWAVWNSTVNVTFFTSIKAKNRGGMLGGFGAMNNFGAVIGSLFSGYICYYIGYAPNFAVSAVLMLVSFLALRLALSGVDLKKGLDTV